MVVLDKPIGLTLAPDPSTGHVYVQQVQPGMSAADSKLVLVSERLGHSGRPMSRIAVSNQRLDYIFVQLNKLSHIILQLGRWDGAAQQQTCRTKHSHAAQVENQAAISTKLLPPQRYESLNLAAATAASGLLQWQSKKQPQQQLLLHECST